MRAVQMTLDDDLLAQVDAAARAAGASRSAFTREVLRAAVGRLKRGNLERRHRDGYRRHPVQRGEFEGWEREQAWGDP